LTAQQLKPAIVLSKKNGVRFPNESDGYRHARDELLAEEIELRRHIERVAEQRRALPPGGGDRPAIASRSHEVAVTCAGAQTRL
jgi:Bacterial protein of unknown function (DUF899)